MIENVCGAGTFSFHYCDFDISFCLLGEKNLVCVIVFEHGKIAARNIASASQWRL